MRRRVKPPGKVWLALVRFKDSAGLRKFLLWFAARLKEPLSWVSLGGALTTVLSLNVSSEKMTAVATIGSTLTGLLGFILKDTGSKDPPEQ